VNPETATTVADLLDPFKTNAHDYQRTMRINPGVFMSKKSKNLSLDREAIRRGERYSRLHRTNLSQLVSGFLRGLPDEAEGDARTLSPAVRRLLGSGAGDAEGRDGYRRHLVEKYGR
jgi:hypothetical protein